MIIRFLHISTSKEIITVLHVLTYQSSYIILFCLLNLFENIIWLQLTFLVICIAQRNKPLKHPCTHTRMQHTLCLPSLHLPLTIFLSVSKGIGMKSGTRVKINKEKKTWTAVHSLFVWVIFLFLTVNSLLPLIKAIKQSHKTKQLLFYSSKNFLVNTKTDFPLISE